MSANAGGGTNPYVVIAGDSLVAALPGPLTGRIANQVGLGAYAQGVPGASYSHYINANLMVGSSGQRLGQTIAELSANPILSVNPQIFVLALGTNDGRIISKEAGTQQGYTIAEMQGSVNTAISQAQARATCVLLVNVAVRPFADGGPNYESAARQINDHLASKATGTVRLIDWQARSAGSADWFNANDIHHTATGMEQYIQAITEGVAQARANGC